MIYITEEHENKNALAYMLDADELSDASLSVKRLYARRYVLANYKFKKTASNDMFKTVPIDVIRSVCENAWTRYGINLQIENISDYNLIKDSGMLHQGIVRFRMENAFNTDDYLIFNIRAEAYDKSDKGVNKLYTSAFKNLAKQEFAIGEVSDDTDAFNEPIIKSINDKLKNQVQITNK